jgi:phospholipase C
MAASIEHILVLMLENRSFDHLLAYSGIVGLTGVDTTGTNPGPKNTTVAMSSAALDRAGSDPGHEFEDVDCQIYHAKRGPSPAANDARPIKMEGFVDESGASAMACAAPALVPVFTHLAREFMVCDQWFSSMPGPTWPNRFFVHAGSSGGLANSPGDLTTVASMTFPELGFSFANGTLFDALEKANPKRTWRVYHGDLFPQVCAIDTMPSVFVANPDQFRPLTAFATDVGNGDVANYTFIEPDYSILSRFRNGNSQHPCGTLSSGEQLIAMVTQALMGSPAVWAQSLLFILYDEHGGFYDQAFPPLPCTPPGDPFLNDKKSAHPPNPAFAFDRYGVRVPAVVVSPWVKPGSVSHQVCDHASVVRTVFDLFGIPGSLTARDRTAASLKPALLGAATTAAPATLPAAPVTAPAVEALPTQPPHDEGALAGFTRIAASVHHALDQYTPAMAPAQLDSVLKAVPNLSPALNVPITSDSQAQRDYIQRVGAEVEAHRQRTRLGLTP